MLLRFKINNYMIIIELKYWNDKRSAIAAMGRMMTHICAVSPEEFSIQLKSERPFAHMAETIVNFSATKQAAKQQMQVIIKQMDHHVSS